MLSALDLRSRRTSEISTPDGSWFFLCPPEPCHSHCMGGGGGLLYNMSREGALSTYELT